MIAILNPWQGTYRQLKLGRRWWHRLAVVTFYAALVLVLGASWGVGFISLQPFRSHMYIRYTPHTQTQAQYDAAVKMLNEERGKGVEVGESNTPLPVGGYWETPEGSTPSPAERGITWDAAEVVMPDGITAEFESTQAAEIAWGKALRKALLKQWTLSTAIAIVITLAVSYLLQSLYRALLYVVYGSVGDRDSTA